MDSNDVAARMCIAILDDYQRHQDEQIAEAMRRHHANHEPELRHLHAVADIPATAYGEES